MATAIVVKIELGHIAQFRDVPTLDGHTHDWMVFVKGADGIDIEHFVEKVVFWLHESYGQPKHVIKAPPYEVKETGYAGFNMLIDIHFKNKSEPKTVRFHYDMFLHMETMPPVNHTRIEMLTFTSPADDFKKKLLRAGGVLQVQDGSSQTKEKKVKEVGHSDTKHRQSNESDRKSKSAMKMHKQKSQKDESKRRSSVTEADLIKKKKIEEKLNSSAPTDKKPREKLNKIKIKIEKGQPPSLFSREESIDIKQIKKKEPSKREDTKASSEKRPSPPDVKIKKESSERIEKFPEKRKKEKKPPPSVLKIKQETKQKKRRTMSSSDSDLAPPKKVELMRSDSDSEEERRIRKKMKKDKLKEAKKLAKKMKKEEVRKPSPLPPKRDNTELMDMDICETPPHNTFVVNSDTSFARSSAPNSGKEKRHKSSKPRAKITTTPTSVGNHNKEVLPGNSPQLKRKKEKSSHSSSSHKERLAAHSSDKKPRSKPTPTRESRLPVTSDSDSSAVEQEPERVPSRQQVFQQDLISPIRSSSESPSPVRSPLPPLLLHKDTHDVTSDDAASVSSRDDRESDSEGDLFEENSPQHRNPKSFPPEKKRLVETSPPSRVARPPSPMVTVSVGTELKNFPGLNANWFEQLKQLQNALSQIRDAAVKKKVRSIVQKSGQFAMDGDAMDFDLCALDRKTIHKIQKHLKVH
uniref:Protein AF-9-like n=1 Tax=Phallusia mammillata TaxID=59560 RepID=A0A6F9DLK3_9ASCI|nr:protein AF-9-like [Phallusia mammillata]